MFDPGDLSLQQGRASLNQDQDYCGLWSNSLRLLWNYNGVFERKTWTFNPFKWNSMHFVKVIICCKIDSFIVVRSDFLRALEEFLFSVCRYSYTLCICYLKKVVC
ncbi:hypothetical protein GIB67_032170, partial [Kingdonia uniflora]